MSGLPGVRLLLPMMMGLAQTWALTPADGAEMPDACAVLLPLQLMPGTWKTLSDYYTPSHMSLSFTSIWTEKTALDFSENPVL